MRIVPFPGRDEAGAGDAWQAELEAALSGDAEGAAANFWRELRADVRATAAPIAPEFEGRLAERLAAQGAQLRVAARLDRARAAVAADEPARPAARAAAREAPEPAPSMTRPAAPTTSRPARAGGPIGRLRRPLARLMVVGHRGAVAGLVAVVALAVVVAVIVTGPSGAGNEMVGERAPNLQHAASSPAVNAPAATIHAPHRAMAPSDAGASGGAASSPSAASSASVAGGEAGASGRVQQRAATLSLSASASEVQTVADRVARLATSLGGFVQSSQVQVLAPQEGTSRAELALRLPSAKLTAALAALGQLAPVRSESQSLQDITNAYDAVRQRLEDANAERQALLRALAGASTEGQIDSLRGRLAQARRAIAEAQSAFKAVSQRASTSEVEVNVVGDAHATSEGLTLHRGLHDAGRVLVVTLAVLLIALAVLAPLALLILALASARRAWLRHQRERVLDGR